MKLLTKYYRIYLLITIPVFIIVGIGYYFLLLQIITNKADEQLIDDKAYIIAQLDDSEHYLDLIADLTDDYTILKSSKPQEKKNTFSTLLVYDSHEEQEEPYRQLKCTVFFHDAYYDLTIRKSMVEYESIMYSILILGIVFTLLLIIGFSVINRILTKKIWSPFYNTLQILSNYSPESGKELQLTKSTIDEFDLLNQTVKKMSIQIRNDFFQQKKFIDHVAHEVQTPLSIVNANIENVLQNKHLTQEDYLSIQNISESSIKLSRIVKSLLLLSKIENNQFEDLKSFNLVSQIDGYFVRQREHLENNNILYLNGCTQDFEVEMNAALMEILVSNLCQNAIRHNIVNGKIWLKVICDTAGKIRLTLTNTGSEDLKHPERMFEMFQKRSKNPESMGIGLSVVKEICYAHNLSIHYISKEGIHQLTLGKY